MKTSLCIFTFAFLVGAVGSAQAAETFEITQEARNLTKQNFVWTNTVQAEPGDRLEFRITMKWQGSQTTQNVLVAESLGQGLSYQGNLKLSGSPLAGNITQENINIGQLTSSQSKTVTFEAQVAQAEAFTKVVTQIVNTATVFNADSAASTFSTVQVSKAGVPTDVPTGPLSMGTIALALALLVAVGVGTLLFIRSYIKREVLESPYETRAHRALAAHLERIRKQREP